MPDLFGDVSTADTGERSDNDFYETKPWMVRSLLHHYPQIVKPGTWVLECASGRDAIANVLREYPEVQVITNDIDPAHTMAQYHEDATQERAWRGKWPFCDWVVSNCPFNIAHEILPHALNHSRLGVAVLLRKTYLEPTKGRKLHGEFVPGRGPWLQAHPPTGLIGLPRYGFRGAGSDSVSCDWMIWEHGKPPCMAIDAEAESR